MSASNRKASTCQQQHGSRLAEAAQPENFWKTLQDAVLRSRRRQIRESDTDGAPRFQENNASHPRTVRAGARNRAGVRLKGDRRQCGMREAAAASGGAAQPRAVRRCRALPAHRPTDPPARPGLARPAPPPPVPPPSRSGRRPAGPAPPNGTSAAGPTPTPLTALLAEEDELELPQRVAELAAAAWGGHGGAERPSRSRD